MPGSFQSVFDRTASEADESQTHPAELAALVHVSDEEPGIRRKGRKRFSYVGLKGKEVSDPETLDRIRMLAIPPAWTDVWISPDPEGHIQATGRDLRGRKQYRYHARWTAFRDEAKYSSLIAFADALPRLRLRVDADLRRKGTPRERVLAAIVWLLDNTMIRVGNDAYARENKSFGLTTLRRKHLTVEGSTLRFSFKGKSGKEWRVRLSDRRIARVMRSLQELPGQELFKYIDESGERRQLRSQDVNGYIREAMGEAFSSKHFRTWGGTIAAAHFFEQVEVAESKAGQRRAINATIDRVAALLGNTRSVCRACYIHPGVIEDWCEGALAERLAAARKAVKRPRKGLDRLEAVVARWLNDRHSGTARKKRRPPRAAAVAAPS
ncbi:MAG: DNA topoisomerase IB [Rhizobiaceae bacterium]